ncbi:MAG: SGNH/GDSL hydrolase family protein [Phycisphaerae bacterium]|nr:SGNH/GDSL hydrolase family protein [Tepidisphaeraceae bacterium]
MRAGRAIAICAGAVAGIFGAAGGARADVFTIVPTAQTDGYTLTYTLGIPTTGGLNAGTVPYTLDASGAIARGSFDRIAYYMELQPTAGGPLQWVFASMNAFTDDARRIGVPNKSGGFFQRPVTSVNVASNVAGVATGNNLSGFNIEFWRTNYTQANTAGVPNASGATGNRNFDWGDQPTAGGYGSMQIHNNGSSQPVFAFNRWGASQGNVDVGIGTNPTTANGIDWTFQQNGASFSVKNLQVLVRTAVTPQPHRLQIMPLGDSITEGAGATGGYRTRLQQRLTAAGIDFEFVGSQVSNPSTGLGATGRVTHEGHSGYRIDQLISGLDSAGTGNNTTGGPGGTDNDGFWFNPTVQPDFILLHIGTNDFGQGVNVSTAKDRLDALITKITTQRPLSTLIVTNLLERTNNPTANDNINTMFNPFVEGIVNTHKVNGEKVFFLDMDSALNVATDLGDGLHPNQAGYDKMGDAWFAAIQAVPEPGAGLALVGALIALAKRRRRSGRVRH